MSKARLFIDNFLVYGLGGIISKVIPLAMLPIITRLMPDPTYYGLFDLSATVVSFGTSFAILGMYDAMFRYFFEKEDAEYRREICSTTFLFTLGMSLFVFLVMLLFRDVLALHVFSDEKYGILVYLSAISVLLGATNGILAAPTRMQNKRKVFLVTNTVSPLLGYAVSVPLLLRGHYLIALPLAGIVSSVIIEAAFAYLNRDFFHVRKFRREHLWSLLKLALPLAPVFLVYWVFNSSDRLMLSKMLGVEANGIYSIGAKLGAASQLIYQAFAGGWQYFAFSTMREKDQVRSNSLVFEYLGVVSFASCMFICAICKEFYELVFAGEYVQGYIVSPYLFLSPLLLMLYQVAGNQFLVVKKSWPGSVILAAGAVSNVLLNWALIPLLGVEGAGLATLLGYVVTVVLAALVLIRMRLMVVSARFVAAAALSAAYFVGWRMWLVDSLAWGLLAAAAGSAALAAIYWSDIRARWRA